MQDFARPLEGVIIAEPSLLGGERKGEISMFTVDDREARVEAGRDPGPEITAGYLNIPPVCSDEVGEVATLYGDNLPGRHAYSSAHTSHQSTMHVHVV